MSTSSTPGSASVVAARVETIVEIRRRQALLEAELRQHLVGLGQDLGFGARKFAADDLAIVLAESCGTTARWLEQAEMFCAHPAVMAKVAEGSWSIRHADAVLGEVAGQPAAVQQQVIEAVLACGARTPYQLRKAAQAVVYLLDPQAAERKAATAKDNRSVGSYVDGRGGASFWAGSSKADVAALLAGLDVHAAVAGPGDTRTLGQRRFDALLDLVCGRILPGAWQAIVLVEESTLTGATEAPAEIPGLGLITATEARQVLAQAELRRAVIDDQGHLVSVDSTVAHPDATAAAAADTAADTAADAAAGQATLTDQPDPQPEPQPAVEEQQTSLSEQQWLAADEACRFDLDQTIAEVQAQARGLEPDAYTQAVLRELLDYVHAHTAHPSAALLAQGHDGTFTVWLPEDPHDPPGGIGPPIAPPPPLHGPHGPAVIVRDRSGPHTRVDTAATRQPRRQRLGTRTPDPGGPGPPRLEHRPPDGARPDQLAVPPGRGPPRTCLGPASARPPTASLDHDRPAPGDRPVPPTRRTPTRRRHRLPLPTTSRPPHQAPRPALHLPRLLPTRPALPQRPPHRMATRTHHHPQRRHRVPAPPPLQAPRRHLRTTPPRRHPALDHQNRTHRRHPTPPPPPRLVARRPSVEVMTDLRAALADGYAAARADLEALVRVPSISSDPDHDDDVRAVIDRVGELARDAGAQQTDVVDAGGHPALIASWPAPAGMPTVLLYAHADVQPTGEVEEWTSPPFAPTERAGRLYARGAADDKAGVLMHLAVLRAFGGKPPVGVVLFIEGEEEIGSPTLTRLLAQHKEALRSDVIVIADAGNAAVDVPALTTSLRGLADLYVEVRLLERPVHSGMFGGPVADALTILCRLLATLHDEAGNVAIEGLRHGKAHAPDMAEDVYRADAGLLPSAQLIGCGSIVDRLWDKPAASVLGIDAPTTAQASNVLLPRARAKVSLRIAPGDDAATAMKAFTQHLESRVEWGAEISVTEGSAGDPFSLETTGVVYDLARRTFAEAYGNEVVETGIGGSIPFIAEFARAYPGATVLVTGVGDPASRWHGIDESLDLAMWQKACLAEALLLQGLSQG